jgi:hypothetical protein
MGTPINFIDLTGQRFGALEVTGLVGKSVVGEAIWGYRCECGAVGQRVGGSLRRGKGVCSHRPFWKIPGYRSWTAMKRRCYNRQDHNYPAYGGSGVTVCDRWRASFHDFIKDMGPRPTPRHTVDRWPNPAGNYEPGNCRWATAAEQNRNKRNSVWVEHNGEKVLLVDLAQGLGLERNVVFGRLKGGWSLGDALTVPVRAHKPYKPRA